MGLKRGSGSILLALALVVPAIAAGNEPETVNVSWTGAADGFATVLDAVDASASGPDAEPSARVFVIAYAGRVLDDTGVASDRTVAILTCEERCTLWRPTLEGVTVAADGEGSLVASDPEHGDLSLTWGPGHDQHLLGAVGSCGDAGPDNRWSAAINYSFVTASAVGGSWHPLVTGTLGDWMLRPAPLQEHGCSASSRSVVIGQVAIEWSNA